MTRAKLLALADRVEREEPSDELNWCIQEAVHPEWRRTTAEPYTTSRDAAASIVGPTWMATMTDVDDDGWVVMLHHPLLPDVSAEAPTEPRARTAAALRARAMEMTDD